MIDAIAERSPLGGLERWLGDAAIDEVIVNGGGDVWIEHGGRLLRVATMSRAAVATAIEHILRPIGRRIDRTNPTVDARLPDGSRVCAVIEPVAVDGPCLTIRRFATRPLPLAAFAPEVRRASAARRRCRPMQRVGQRRHFVWQDDPPQRARRARAHDGADHHARGHRRVAAAASPRRAARDPTGQRRGHRRDHPRPTAADCTAHATRPAGARRGSRRGGSATRAGDEHRPRRFDVDGSCQLRGRCPRPSVLAGACKRCLAGHSRQSTIRFGGPSTWSFTSADPSTTNER